MAPAQMDSRKLQDSLGPFFGVLASPRTYALMLGSSAALGAALSIVGVGLLILLRSLVDGWGFALAVVMLGIGQEELQL